MTSILGAAAPQLLQQANPQVKPAEAVRQLNQEEINRASQEAAYRAITSLQRRDESPRIQKPKRAEPGFGGSKRSDTAKTAAKDSLAGYASEELDEEGSSTQEEGSVDLLA